MTQNHPLHKSLVTTYHKEVGTTDLFSDQSTAVHLYFDPSNRDCSVILRREEAGLRFYHHVQEVINLLELAYNQGHHDRGLENPYPRTTEEILEKQAKRDTLRPAPNRPYLPK